MTDQADSTTEFEVTAEAQVLDDGRAGTMATVPGLGNVTKIFVKVGSSRGARTVRLTITGLNLMYDYPWVILLTPRQGQDQNRDFGWIDTFAVQVISSTREQVTCRIFRVDNEAGWEQNLHLSGLIVD